MIKNAPSPEHTKPLLRFWHIVVLLCSLALMLSWEQERMFWPYMIAAYLVAALLYVVQPRHPPGNMISYLFPKSVWLHPSAIRDYYISIINFFLIIFMMNALVPPPDGVAQLIAVLESHWNIGQIAGPPPLFALILYTACALLLSDLFYYISHRLTHEIPLLWEFHKVHHSAEVMTPVTVYRMHPVDLWINQSFRVIGLGIASGIFLYIYPDIDGLMTIAGINAGLLLTALVGANLRHSHIQLSFGPYIEHLVISPAQHQIHHSTNPRHFNKNYGSLLSLWDWMFGSLYVPKGYEELNFGLGGEQETPYRTLTGLYFHPFKKLLDIIIDSKKAP